MPASDIIIKGAREHNLRDVDLVLPRNQLICLTGVSGSGKSSLAFDTLFAEGQRRYVESLSSFARQFLGQMPKPDVDLISGLSPSISISQKSSGNNPRSTVGTITEIYDFLRILYARVGQGYCPKCDAPIASQSRDQIIGNIMRTPNGTKYDVLAPIVRGQKGEHRDKFVALLKQGYSRVRVDGKVVSLSSEINLDRQQRHNIEVVIDRLTHSSTIRARLSEAVELALKLGKGALMIAGADEAPKKSSAKEDAAETEVLDDEPVGRKKGRTRKAKRMADRVYSSDFACGNCAISFSPPTPQMFSFNSPQGMCDGCDGLGMVYTFDPEQLIPDTEKSFQQGCIELIGKWREVGRWRQHIYQGVADTVERIKELEPGTMLETAWEDLPEELQRIWLYGAGDMHITYTWRGGSSPMKYGGTFSGVVSELDEKYQSAKSAPKIRALEEYMDELECAQCHGMRLNRQARHFRLETKHKDFSKKPNLALPDVCQLSIKDVSNFFQELELDEVRQYVATEPLKEIRNRLGFLLNVGLDYLTLDRTAPTLSGGESQRIRLAGQIGAGLVGVLYILDEPSIGLHPRDNDRLIHTLGHLRDLGNTVVVVEHDEDTMRASDHIIDFGPGPGIKGGEVVFEGSPSKIGDAKKSVTGQFLAGKREIEIPAIRRPIDPARVVRILGARHNNLKNIDIEVPLGMFVCVTGVSGSGKSSFVNDILKETLREELNNGIGDPGDYDTIEGVELMDKMIAIDQSPIGRTPRSNPGTYIKLFDEIRKLYTQLPEAKRRGYKPGRFSFNVKGGRCEACEGNGSNKLEMDFLADVWVTCPVCQGQRFNRETLQVKYRDKSIAEVLEMSIVDACDFFENFPKIHNKLKTLQDVGLNYLTIGQPSPTLSGGEAQRIKLARELVKRSTGKTLYLLDEPTTGLHFADIQLLLNVLRGFVDAGNTVLVVAHNLDVIKTADWIIDIGPEGGSGGGEVVVAGTPETVAACKKSKTGQALAKSLNPKAATDAEKKKPQGKSKSTKGVLAQTIKVRGAQQHNLRQIDVDIARDSMSVFCGPSGSGKSSLAMDTIYAEGQRRYVESLSSYARQFVNQLEKPRVEQIEGLSPAIAIEQKNLGSTPRSTVGTVTEVYDYFRILFSRLGAGYCPDCDNPIGTQTSDQVVDKIMAAPEGERMILLAPIALDTNQTYEQLWEEIQAKGFVRVRIDGVTHNIQEIPTLNRRARHAIEIVVDRIVIKKSSHGRIADSVESALSIGAGVINVAIPNDDIPEVHWRTVRHSQHLACDCCGRSFETLSPHSFSFNSRLGWCGDCEGLGTQVGADPKIVLKSPESTLAEGAILLWPNMESEVAKKMMESMCRSTGIPIDVPFSQLDARHRRMVFYGTGNRWFEVEINKSTSFSFQFQGLYPTLDQASRLSPALRQKLQSFVGDVECGSCGGSRIRDDAAAMRFRDTVIDGVCRMPLGRLAKEIKSWKLDKREQKIAGELLREILNRVEFLLDVGLNYLTLSRTAASLSNGEAQRIRLASQLGSGLCGVLYVLDEPTIGLHPRDNTRLLGALHRLRDLGNTLLVVEHDREVIENSDHVFDFGPKAGSGGGEIVASGTPVELGKKRGSVTGPYLSGKKRIPIPKNRRPTLAIPKIAKATKKKATKKKATKKKAAAKKPETPEANTINILGAQHNNLKNIDVRLPLGALTVVTGPSGCGKSSLINEVLYNSLARRLHRASTSPGTHKSITGIEYINKVIRVDQTPLGNSPSSNPATYTGAFELIRNLYAQLPDATVRGYTARRFSFNVPGGRCEECFGNGQICIEMHFLPDVWVQCKACNGQRYNDETLAVRFNGKNINDVLTMPCSEAVKLFKHIPKIRRILQTLCDVGLDYLTLGQSAPTLSGGEAQRVKLSAELARPDTGRTLYLLDEPTTGLHFDDLAKLLNVLQQLVDIGNTVVLIEHNLDIIKAADWVIDMGPEAGAEGGQIVIQGPPETIVEYAVDARKSKSKKKPRSWTGEALEPVLAEGPYKVRKEYNPSADRWKKDDMEIEDVGRSVKMPWEVDGRRWHTQDRVGRNGEPVKWSGEVLARVVDYIQQHEGFAETDWTQRAQVEIAGENKKKGWFFQAITGETWLLKMKFRVRAKTFNRDELLDQVPLRSANEMDDLPIYGNQPRVQLTSKKAAWQEVEIRAHTLEEMDIPGFWKFLETAVAGFAERTKPLAETKLEDHTPWAKLGQKWHYLPKGFPQGKVQWDINVLQSLEETLVAAVPEINFGWNHEEKVDLYLPDQEKPWATIQTKRTDALLLQLHGPHDSFSPEDVEELVDDSSALEAEVEDDVLQMNFKTAKQVKSPALKKFLRQHIKTLLA